MLLSYTDDTDVSLHEVGHRAKMYRQWASVVQGQHDMTLDPLLTLCTMPAFFGLTSHLHSIVVPSGPKVP